MKVLLIDVDSKIPNLALMKIAMYHEAKGDEVIWNMELMANQVDKIYVSCVFDWNRSQAAQFEAYPYAVIGGSGYSLTTTLPEEIEEMKPRINFGFTTRGCIRGCKFCVVPKKEGKIRAVGDIYDIWDGKSKEIVLMDNNILALPEHFMKIAEQIKKEKLKVDFNQGLDHRLLTPEIAKTLAGLSHEEYRFSFDHINGIGTVIKAIEMLKANGVNRSHWYVLVGFDSTPLEDVKRLNVLKALKQVAYVQRYNFAASNPFYTTLAGWANAKGLYRKFTYRQHLMENGASYKWTKEVMPELLASPELDQVDLRISPYDYYAEQYRERIRKGEFLNAHE